MLLHLSDLHFGTEKPECLTAIEDFCRQHRPEVIVVSGDLTQRARFIQFYNCKQFLESLNVPYLVVPGNHDIPLYHLWNRFFRRLCVISFSLVSLNQRLKQSIFLLWA